MKFLAVLLASTASFSLNIENQEHLYLLTEMSEEPHVYRGEAYTPGQHDVTNPAAYAADSPKGYLQPITGKHSLAATYPSKDSASYITPYNQRDHAWNEAQHDMTNETHWVLGSPENRALDVKRPLYHEITNGTVGGGKDFHGAIDQPGFDNHFKK